MAAQWLTMAEYARRNGITREAVRQAVKNGRIENNGKTGRECRVRGPLAEPVHAVAPATSNPAADTRLAEVKLAKLKADVELQRQRIAANVNESRRAYVEMILEEYVQAFTPFKSRLVELRLTADQLSALGSVVEECLQSFLARVQQRIDEEP